MNTIQQKNSTTDSFQNPDGEELFSEELQEVISHQPHWIVNKGIYIVGLIVCCLLTIAAFLDYPEQISSRLRIIKSPDLISHTLIQSPGDDEHFYGEMFIHQSNLVHLKKGQKVIIQFEKYPSSKYGYLYGHIADFIPLYRDQLNCKILVSIPKNGKSSYNKVLLYEQDLVCEGRIVTHNQNLLKKVINLYHPL